MTPNRLRIAALSLAALAAMSGCASADEPWPNLNAAEANLQAALNALQRAPDRFGGHKHQAEQLIHGAMSEIEQAKHSFR